MFRRSCGIIMAAMAIVAALPASAQQYPNRTVEVIVAYGPGARAIFESLREGEPIADRGTREERRETVVSVWSGGRAPEQRIIVDTLSFGGFLPGGAGTGPESMDAGETTAVYSLPGYEEQAEWVAATLGTTVEELNEAVVAASNGKLKGVMNFTTHPNVSIDFNHDPHSSTVALDQTKVMDGNFVSVLSWYDNEWGFSNRMADTAAAFGKVIA
jgi:hypothetical protein